MSFERPDVEDFPYLSYGEFSTKIDSEYMRPGCREPDCIPSIDSPKFISDKESKKEWNSQEIEILAMFIIDNNQINEVYAFPIKIMDYHEIVNFTHGNKQLAMTYCPLCQTSAGYSRHLDEKIIEMGVSGLLYNSALVIYDRNTFSLFSQVWSEGILGDFTGSRLKQYPVIQTTLTKLSEEFPTARYLSRETGNFPHRQKKYDKNPYGDYSNNKEIPFPVSTTDDKLFTKSLVYKIEFEENDVIIPWKRIEDTLVQQHTSGLFSQSIAGGRLFFSSDEELKWDDWIPSQISYYFAARAYYPESIIL